MPDPDEIFDRRRPVHGEPVEEPTFIEPRPPALTGRSVRLDPVDADRDAAELFECGHGDGAQSLWRFMPYGPFSSAGEMREWLRRCAASSGPLWFVARGSIDGSAVGMAAIMEIRVGAGVAEIGHIWIAPRFQRSREATEALFLLADHVLTACRYRRLEWKCDALNTRSRAAARRLGFRYEGTFYNHMIVKGRNRDTAWFSILDSEWPPLRNRLVRWLDPSNFDADGRQRRSLREMAEPGGDKPRLRPLVPGSGHGGG
ncbi:MAG: GNAT family protein [Rhodospirillales bacterium]|nr:GNAT family protein [Rhodospirillales bacterium]